MGHASMDEYIYTCWRSWQLEAALNPHLAFPALRPANFERRGKVRERRVKLFAQHGFSDGLKTVEGLRKELIDGVIFSPRDITPEKLRECASKFTESAPISERLFDPQYYATLSALDPCSRTGYLQEEYACYFGY
jgi:hypothetical protein